MILPNDELMIFAGNSNKALACEVAKRLGIKVSKARVEKFSDGEVAVEIETSVRGKDVFVIQSVSFPTNTNLMELLVLIDALKWASARRITAVLPYMGYARQDRRPRSVRVPITARLVAKMLKVAGSDRCIVVDLHADQIVGYFDIPVDNIYASPVLLGDIWSQEFPNPVVVSPDVGGVTRARSVAKRLDDCGLAIIDKRRPKANESEVMHVIGDVEGKSCIIIDDLVDTAGTLCKGAAALKEHGASLVVAYCTHAVLSGPALERIQKSELDQLIVTNTIQLSSEAKGITKIRQICLSELIAETINRVSNDESVISLFVD